MQYDDRDLRKLQLLELRILKEIDRVCRELGITYFLDSGSVLGALRHGGFIPWDDDIDLGMPRADEPASGGAVRQGVAARHALRDGGDYRIRL